MEAETSELLETCDESRMLIETVGNIIGDNSSQDGKYFVVTEVHGEQANLIEITETEKLVGTDELDQNQPWDKICRICANTSDHLIPIFQGEGLEHELSNKIHRHLPIQVSEEDSLPLHLCYHCAATLLAWDELSEGCLAAEQRLLQMQNDLKDKDESEEQLGMKEECNEETSTNDSERLHGEEYTVSVLQKPRAESLEEEESSYQETLEYVECGKCKAMYIDIIELVAHMNSEHNDSVHYCTYCKTVYRGNVTNFEQHKKNHTSNGSTEKETPENFLTTLCNSNNTSKLKSLLPKHTRDKQVLNQTEQKLYTCNECERSFNRKYDLRRHICLHGDIGSIENEEELEILNNAKVIIDDRCLYKCNTCEKRISTKRGFLRHIRIHTGSRPCICTLCGNQYRIKQDLVRHIRDVHDRIKKYQCGICARPFANKGAKEDHQRIHTGERPYSCKLCKKSFRTLNSIYIHNRTHTNYKPHKCPSCDKQFPSRQRLNNHVTTHTGIKEFSCEICFKLFSVKSEVVRHRAIHSQDKPFLCTICGSKFGQKRYLRTHIRQHHKEQSTLLLAKLTESSY